MPNDLVTATVAARLLGVHRATFYRGLNERLTAHKVDGGGTVYDRQEVLNLAAELADAKSMTNTTEAA